MTPTGDTEVSTVPLLLNVNTTLFQPVKLVRRVPCSGVRGLSALKDRGLL